MARENFDFVVHLKDKFTRALTKLRRGTSDFLGTLGRITGVSAAVSAALAGLGGIRVFTGAIRSAIDFEEQLARVRGVSGATVDEMRAIEAEADRLGATTRFTAQEAAAGIEELTRAGFNVAEAIESIGPSLNLAQANSIELSQAAQLVSTSLRQFGEEASQSTRFADVLTRATQRSAQNVEQLERALRQAAPNARQAGLEIETTAALIGKLADQGFRGERGGTALRNALAQLQDPTSKFRKELAALGITSTDFLTVLSDLEARGDDANQAIRALGLESAPAIQALVKSGGAGLRELIADLNGASGAAANTAAEMDNTLGGALAGLRSAFDAFRRSLVKPLLGPLRKEVQAVSQQLRDFAKSETFAQIRDALVSVFGAAVKAAREFISEIDFSQASDKIIEFASTAKEKFDQFAANAKSASNTVGGLFDGLRVAIGGFKTGIEAAIGAIAKFGQVGLEAFAAYAEANPFARILVDAEDLANKAQFFGDVASEAFTRAKEDAAATAEAWQDLQDRLEGSGEAAEGAGKALDDTAESLNKAGAAADGLVPKAQAAGDALGAVKTAAEGASGSLEGFTESAAEGADEQEQLRNRLAELTEEYSALQKAGLGATQEARDLEFQMQRVQAELNRTAQASADTAEAFQALGIKSQAELQRTAEQAQASADTIIAAYHRGEAAIEDVRRAFIVAAEAQLQVVDGSDEYARRTVEAHIRHEAAALGVTEALVDLGLAGEEAGEKVADGADRATEALERTADAAKDVEAATAQAATATAAATAPLNTLAQSADGAAASLGELTEEQRRQLDAALQTASAYDNLVLGEIWRQEAEALKNDALPVLDEWIAKYERYMELRFGARQDAQQDVEAIDKVTEAIERQTVAAAKVGAINPGPIVVDIRTNQQELRREIDRAFRAHKRTERLTY